MANEKRLIDANGSYTLNANDNTGYSICFCGGIISVFDDFGRCVCEFDAEDATTVDAVEVVRCKDCKFAYINDFAKVQEKALCNHWCNHDGNSVLLEADDFCSYGERKDNDI